MNRFVPAAALGASPWLAAILLLSPGCPQEGEGGDPTPTVIEVLCPELASFPRSGGTIRYTLRATRASEAERASLLPAYDMAGLSAAPHVQNGGAWDGDWRECGAYCLERDVSLTVPGEACAACALELGDPRATAIRLGSKMGSMNPVLSCSIPLEAFTADAGSDAGPTADAGPTPDGGPGCSPTTTLTFEDGDFASAGSDWDYEIASMRGVTPEVDPPTTPGAGGNPGAYRRIVHRVTATDTEPGAIFTAHTYAPADHDPAARPVCRLEISIDLSDAEMSPASREALVRLIIRQDGNIYATELFHHNAGEWRSSPVYSESDISHLYGGGPAMFNLGGGGTLRFGYLVGASRPTTFPGPSGDVITGVDNFRVVLHVTD